MCSFKELRQQSKCTNPVHYFMRNSADLTDEKFTEMSDFLTQRHMFNTNKVIAILLDQERLNHLKIFIREKFGYWPDCVDIQYRLLKTLYRNQTE